MMLQNDPDTMAQVEKLTAAVNELSRVVAMLLLELSCGSNHAYPLTHDWCEKNGVNLINEVVETQHGNLDQWSY